MSEQLHRISGQTPAARSGYQLLLVEPSSMVRGLISQVTKELGLAQVHQTSNWKTAHQWMAERHMDALIVSGDEPEHAEELLTLLRMNQFRSSPDVPVVGLVPKGDERTRARLEALNVERFISVPFKIREVVETLYALWPAALHERLAGHR